MSLDIEAFEKVTLVRACEDPDLDPDETDLHFLTTDEHFRDRQDGLPVGYYRTEGRSFGFAAGPYGTYNEWRGLLSRVLLDATDETVWDHPEHFAGNDIVLLVDFPDNEGFFGPQSSARLAAALKAQRPKWEKFAGKHIGRRWLIETYDNFQKAFELAASGGVVDFG